MCGVLRARAVDPRGQRHVGPIRREGLQHLTHAPQGAGHPDPDHVAHIRLVITLWFGVARGGALRYASPPSGGGAGVI
jgi:hypothetical protein